MCGIKLVCFYQLKNITSDQIISLRTSNKICRINIYILQALKRLDKTKQCTHGEEQKALKGTRTTDEVQKALEKGYKTMKIYETQNFEKKSNALFQEYIKWFLKIKLVTSPWKNDYQTVNMATF